MKKYLLSLMTIMMVAMTSMCFVACGDDDDDESESAPESTTISASSLYGLWECSYMKVTFEGQTIEREVDPRTADRLEVFQDATYKIYEYSDSKATWVLDEVGTWVLQNNVLTATDNKGKQHSITIFKVTADTFSYKPNEESKRGEQYEVTYRRVK